MIAVGNGQARGSATMAPGLRRTALAVAGRNLAYFHVEFIAAFRIGSTALFPDSADFLEDAAVNLLIAAAVGWPARARARVGMLLAWLMVLPAGTYLWMVWRKLVDAAPPEAFTLGLVGAGALAVNLSCALLLARHRREGGSLARAALLSARNDAAANLAIIAAGLLTLAWASIRPDIAVGIGIAWLNLDAAAEVVRAAEAERREGPETPRP